LTARPDGPVRGEPFASAGWPVPGKEETLVKVCGITTAEAATAAGEAGADFVGFVHYPASPRHVEAEAIARLSGLCPGAVGVVVTVDPDDRTLDRIVSLGTPAAIQLHGGEGPERVAEIEARHGIRVVKALGIGGPDDVARARDFDCLLLLDAKPPKDASRPGGLGRRFDWRLLEDFDRDRPYLLSGGLTAASARDAVDRLRPYGVDVSSGVESGGAKDTDKIRHFVATVKKTPDKVRRTA